MTVKSKNQIAAESVHEVVSKLPFPEQLRVWLRDYPDKEELEQLIATLVRQYDVPYAVIPLNPGQLRC